MNAYVCVITKRNLHGHTLVNVRGREELSTIKNSRCDIIPFMEDCGSIRAQVCVTMCVHKCIEGCTPQCDWLGW